MLAEDLRMFDLIDEITGYCAVKGSKYYLIGYELLYAVLGKRAASCIADICMTYDDYKHIEDDLLTQEHRTLESISTNPDMPGLYFRYVDTESLMIQPEYHKVRKDHGITVNIHIIRNSLPESSELLKYEAIMESGIEGVNDPDDSSAAKIFRKKKKKGEHAEWLLDLLARSSFKEERSESFLKIPQAGVICFPERFWSDSTFITIGNKNYNTVSEPKLLLSQWFGEGYENKMIKPLKDNFRVIVDPGISYRHFSDDFWHQFDQGKEFWEQRTGYLDFYYDRWLELNNIQKEKQNYLYYIRSLFFLWKRYYYKKTMIKEMMADERYDELAIIFRDMDLHINEQLKYGRVPAFDEEIMNIYLSVLDVQGESGRVDLIKNALCDNPVSKMDSKEIMTYFDDMPEESIRIRDFLSSSVK